MVRIALKTLLIHDNVYTLRRQVSAITGQEIDGSFEFRKATLIKIEDGSVRSITTDLEIEECISITQVSFELTPQEKNQYDIYYTSQDEGIHRFRHIDLYLRAEEARRSGTVIDWHPAHLYLQNEGMNHVPVLGVVVESGREEDSAVDTINPILMQILMERKGRGELARPGSKSHGYYWLIRFGNIQGLQLI